MSPNNLVLNQTCKFLFPLTVNSREKKKEKKSEAFFLYHWTLKRFLSYFPGILTHFFLLACLCILLEHLQDCMRFLASFLDSLFIGDLQYMHLQTRLVFLLLKVKSWVGKEKTAKGFHSCELRTAHAELLRCNFVVALLLSSLFIPPCWAPLEKMGRWTSAHGKRVPLGVAEPTPPPPLRAVLLHPHMVHRPP